MENNELIRVVFYVQDSFRNPHFLRKSSIGYLPKNLYEQSKNGDAQTCFDVGDDYYAERFPETITK